MKKILGIVLIIVGVVICFKFGGRFIYDFMDFVKCNELSIYGNSFRLEMVDRTIFCPFIRIGKEVLYSIIGISLIVVGIPSRKEVN